MYVTFPILLDSRLRGNDKNTNASRALPNDELTVAVILFP